jgi:hypothetical protein
MTEDTIAQTEAPKRKTMTFKVNFKGKPEDVTIRKLGYEEKMELMESGVETQLESVGNKQTAKIMLHPFRQRPAAIKLCMVKGPFDPKTELNDVDVEEVCDEIYEKIEAFNNLNPKKKETSDGPSSTEAETLR